VCGRRRLNITNTEKGVEKEKEMTARRCRKRRKEENQECITRKKGKERS